MLHGCSPLLDARAVRPCKLSSMKKRKRTPICELFLVHGCSSRRTPTQRAQVVRTMTLCPRGYNPPLVRRCGRWRRRYPRRLTVTLACSPCSVPEIPWQEWQGSPFPRVRLRSLACPESPANRSFERTGTNGRERPLALAMQKVVGSSPIIRSPQKPRHGGVFTGLGKDRRRLLRCCGRKTAAFPDRNAQVRAGGGPPTARASSRTPPRLPRRPPRARCWRWGTSARR